MSSISNWFYKFGIAMTMCLLTSCGNDGNTTAAWRSTATTGAPSARFSHTSVWTGSKMIVWGGEADSSNATHTNTGAMYNPAFNSWEATTIVGAPLARSGHSAIWTGDRMIVWGGHDLYGFANVNNAGASYDPSSNTWTSISTNGAPSPRYVHRAIWTGSKMIIWGGYDGTRLDTGGIYDPASDTWKPVSTIGAPSGRSDHTLVWTGSKLIVWGGFDGSNGFGVNTGGIYDPVSDTWQGISIFNAPTPRFGHSAVWTGHKMIIWGGENTGNTGCIYDLSSDSWASISSIIAPNSIRNDAVWTGNKMILWGGLDGNNNYAPTNAGFIYDPITNTWNNLTSSGEINARSLFTSVWTGTQMIIWGGFDGSSTINTGGVYTP